MIYARFNLLKILDMATFNSAFQMVMTTRNIWQISVTQGGGETVRYSEDRFCGLPRFMIAPNR
jgi:hypothetical protein